MITLVGVAHVINLKAYIERIIAEENPDIVAVELDYGRYVALSQRIQGDMPYFYRKMAEMQRNISQMFGTEAGSEMLTAVKIARILGKEVAFIDMDSQRIVESIKRNMGLWEKIRFYSSILFAPFIGKKITRKDVENIISEEDRYIEELRRKYPGLVRALFEEREAFMARNLLSLPQDKNIMAFVGDGHLQGLKRRIPDARVIKLRELQQHSVSYSYRISV